MAALRILGARTLCSWRWLPVVPHVAQLGVAGRAQQALVASLWTSVSLRAHAPLTRAVATVADAPVAPPPKWDSLGLAYQLPKALQEDMDLDAPTDIQNRVIPAILAGKNLVFGSRTGTGKTVAFLAPVIHNIKRDELQHKVATRSRRPRALVLAPSRELAQQILGVAKRLTHQVKYRAVGIAGGKERSAQKSNLDTPVDLLVATPGRLLALRENAAVYLSDVRYVIVDEADTMFSADAGFRQDMMTIIETVQKAASAREDRAVQFIMAGATGTPGVLSVLKPVIPDLHHMAAASVHSAPDRLREEFVRVTSEAHSKHDALRQALKSPLEVPPTLVFCNTVDCARATEHYLQSEGYFSACLHADMPPQRRAEELAKFAKGDASILVCTDAAARGLDFPQVDHVVLYDFPLNAVDYLHRVGRTARAGRKGVVTSFVGKKDLALAAGIQKARQARTEVTQASSTWRRPTKTAAELQPKKRKIEKLRSRSAPSRGATPTPTGRAGRPAAPAPAPAPAPAAGTRTGAPRRASAAGGSMPTSRSASSSRRTQHNKQQ